MQLLQLKWLMRFLFCLILWNSFDVAMAATVSTDAKRYLFNTPIQLSWNYTSQYTIGGRDNVDALVICYNDTIPTLANAFAAAQMYVYTSTLTQEYNITIRNVGTVTFDGNDPVERRNQTWPLQIGNYKAFLFTDSLTNFTVYAASDTFSVVSAVISTSKPSYFYNESITISWNYGSNYIGTGKPNTDIIGVYNSTIMNADLSTPILFVWVGSLNNAVVNTTIRNNGTVTFDSQPPDETGRKSWPLEAGSYKVILYDSNGGEYGKSETFVVRPATANPTKVPTKAPTREPTVAPTQVPSMRKKKQLFCNVFLLRLLFCSNRCDWIGRLLKTCNNNEG